MHGQQTAIRQQPYAAYQRAFVMGLQRNYQGKITALDNLMRSYPNSQYIDDALYEKSRALTMLNREQKPSRYYKSLYPTSQKSAGRSGRVQLGQLYYNSGSYRESIAHTRALSPTSRARMMRALPLSHLRQSTAT